MTPKTESKAHPILKSGFLTLLGLPNAGKSTLLNALVGAEVAIVTPKAQTTWQTMRGHVEQAGLELVVTDTPGLQEGTKALNLAIAKNALRAIASAREGHELVAWVIDSADIGRRLRDKKPLGLDVVERTLSKDCGPLPLKIPAFVIFNKADLVRTPEHRAQIEREVLSAADKIFGNRLAHFWISTHGKKDTTELRALFEAIRNELPEGGRGELFEEETLTDQNLRAICSEYLREQCFMQLGAEIPYSVAVEITKFDESDPAITRIEATLHVERESQKAIVVGTGAAKLKAIGTKAREKMERLLGHKVFLGTRVKVTPHWAKEAQWVERFGYGSEK